MSSSPTAFNTQSNLLIDLIWSAVNVKYIKSLLFTACSMFYTNCCQFRPLASSRHLLLNCNWTQSFDHKTNLFFLQLLPLEILLIIIVAQMSLVHQLLAAVTLCLNLIWKVRGLYKAGVLLDTLQTQLCSVNHCGSLKYLHCYDVAVYWKWAAALNTAMYGGLELKSFGDMAMHTFCFFIYF